ncbi:(-)-delta-cadinene synthase [Madurella mycetomatis]|uniref:Terpene synthase n=1 Tax=Madurella mycetomatis TaxID=100816 RepID=A0A175VTY1_9PEZI|nr:(-)-delta-cadinene synthase [Madurella mycetomatis]
MEPSILGSGASQSPAPPLDLRGSRLSIPNLQPIFASWKQGINPLHGRVKKAVDARLNELVIDDEKTLAKIKAADLGFFAAGLFPDASYEILETVAFYCVWLFLWDDVIDGAADDGENVLAADKYCRESVAFVRHHLGLGEPGATEPPPPTRVCESFAEVGQRVGGLCGAAERTELFGHLRGYMEACVVEHRWRSSGNAPSVDEFYSWRLKTSSVDVLLDLCRILNGIPLPEDILKSREFAAMKLDANKLFILINELFSLKKELKDGEFTNLIPITMRELGTDLSSATRHVVQDIYNCVQDFDSNASTLWETASSERGGTTAEELSRLVEAYQAVATSVLNFSIQSPRYGILKDRREDGSFVVIL